jgi:molecular chaperone GrpE
LQTELAERTADLQRVKAEYDNYRKRVQRDRLAVRQIAVANVLHGLLPVLDAIARARELGEVHGGFQQVAEVLEAELAALGLQSYGEVGERFDPERHEALVHAYSMEVGGPTCSEVLALGYRVGERLLRPAQVAVIEPPAPSRANTRSRSVSERRDVGAAFTSPTEGGETVSDVGRTPESEEPQPQEPTGEAQEPAGEPTAEAEQPTEEPTAEPEAQGEGTATETTGGD